MQQERVRAGGINENEGMLSSMTRLHTWWQGVTWQVTVS